MNVEKLLRTLQVNFPYLLEAKFTLMRLFRNGLSLPFEKDFYAISLFPDVDEWLFLDVGANRGQSTDAILMNRRNARLQLFEPNQLLCQKLRRLFSNDKRIIINNFGLGSESTEGVLYIPFYKKWMFDGLASFSEQNARNWLSNNRIYFYNESFLALKEVKCQIKRLDELELAPFFIKIDIQGYEYQALKGGEQTIQKYKPILLLESPDDRIVKYLKGFNYQFYAFKAGKFFPDTFGSPNTFFMTKEKAYLVKNNIGK
ncbi:FkbM family methyltransferase [Nitrosococcus wardiae]|uniref:FkbM family methyltransferase n=1 Tax=Nitrosococcus wardiae TaxID=1814290 RepID=A0A4P7BWF8_9GAMM|nr:FkbM family methyltransferase [Nitrosococcus wardiae]QBQ54393.1 FkbM family methyltransferase [Nitrosococcus wardiae]